MIQGNKHRLEKIRMAMKQKHVDRVTEAQIEAIRDANLRHGLKQMGVNPTDEAVERVKASWRDHLQNSRQSGPNSSVGNSAV